MPPAVLLAGLGHDMLFLIKPTLDCNGACVYCASAESKYSSSSTRVEGALLRTLYERIAEYVKATGASRTAMLWHGGEPLLLGPDYWRRVREFNARYLAGNGVEVRTLMQSNLTRLEAEQVPILRDLIGDAQISTSFDPISDVRRLRSGESYRDRWLASAWRAHEGGIRLGVVYVVHSESIGRASDIYHFFRNIGLIRGVRFNPLYSAGSARAPGAARLAISSRDWGRFLVELWDVWLADGATFRVTPLDEWRDAARRGGRSRMCSAGGCPEDIMGVSCDGTIYTCGRSMDVDLLPYGNISCISFEEALRSKERAFFENRRARLAKEDCAGCRWWRFCGGGCPNDAYLYYGDASARTYWCEGRRLFFEERLAQLMEGN